MQELFKPSHLKQLAQEYGFQPSKKYGQNYLISKGIIEKLLEAAELKKTDTIVEIGPGFGVLTLALAPHVKEVIAFEIERTLAPYWDKTLEDWKTRRLKDSSNIKIVWGDALREFSIFNLQFSKPYKVVANLPYQITSRALRTILEADPKPELIVVMVQKEVADRIVAKPGEMSLLAVSVQYYGTPKIVARVSKGNFWPEPKVDSAVLVIKTLKPWPRPDGAAAGRHESMKALKQTDEGFFEIVKAGFANKRKQVWKNLSIGLHLNAEHVKSVVKDVTGNEKVRAEELSVEQWKEIHSRIFE